MKVLALGCGDMGRLAVSATLSSEAVTHVTVADKNRELVDTFVGLVGTDKLSGSTVDATDQNQLMELMKTHDLVINTIGPFFKFGKIMLESAIESKVSYVDICDDWKPTQELLELNDRAKKAGITAIIGMGASPGILNLLAVSAANQLEKVDTLTTAWGLAKPDYGPKIPYYVSRSKMPQSTGAGAVYQHLMQQCTGEIPTYQSGEEVYIQAMTKAEPLEIPGYAPMFTAHIGHPEPVTLPRTIQANTISNVIYYGELLTDLLRNYGVRIENEEISLIEASEKIEVEFGETLQKDPVAVRLLTEFPMELCVTATGETANHEAKQVTMGLLKSPYGGMAGMTGVPLSIGAQMILEGKITKKGVLTPEEAVDPTEFFHRYATYCGDGFTTSDVLFEKKHRL